MTKQMFRLYRELIREYPWLQSSANRVIMVTAMLLVSGIVVLAITSYRENTAIAQCKAKGGTPIFVTRVREIPTDLQGDSITQEHREFDRCQL
ncbi:MAG: hypothetical protein KME17_17085 [Cyanosarcina radialis HA8281-LM2]|jgi:hypothetical protein|nr:hypothetical protein [Cyanosarcina radialis HA8281-LM2]